LTTGRAKSAAVAGVATSATRPKVAKASFFMMATPWLDPNSRLQFTAIQPREVLWCCHSRRHSAGEQLTRGGKYSSALSPGAPVADPRPNPSQWRFRPAPSMRLYRSATFASACRLPQRSRCSPRERWPKSCARAFGQPPQVIRRNARARKPRRELKAITSPRPSRFRRLETSKAGFHLNRLGPGPSGSGRHQGLCR
jgi:hypothetical protein